MSGDLRMMRKVIDSKKWNNQANINSAFFTALAALRTEVQQLQKHQNRYKDRKADIKGRLVRIIGRLLPFLKRKEDRVKINE